MDTPVAPGPCRQRHDHSGILAFQRSSPERFELSVGRHSLAIAARNETVLPTEVNTGSDRLDGHFCSIEAAIALFCPRDCSPAETSWQAWCALLADCTMPGPSESAGTSSVSTRARSIVCSWSRLASLQCSWLLLASFAAVGLSIDCCLASFRQFSPWNSSETSPMSGYRNSETVVAKLDRPRVRVCLRCLSTTARVGQHITICIGLPTRNGSSGLLQAGQD